MNIPDFSGKALSIELKDNSINYDLVNPYFEEIAGRLFICGTIPKGSTKSDWCEGKICSLAWEQVEHFYIFESEKDLLNATKKSKKKSKKKK